MAKVVDYENGADLLGAAESPDSWTALVPAAGRGTRLGFDKPKILFPVAGVTILERLVGLLEPLCSQFVLVLSPDGAPVVTPELQRLVGDRGRISLQNQPLGMGDAVACGLSQVRTPNVMVVWGDQFGLKRSSLEFCIRLFSGVEAPDVVCPTLWRSRPYIHFERDAAGVLTQVLQQREGDTLPAEGESDSGVFFFRTEALREGIRLLGEGTALGAVTRELNFLPIFPLMDRMGKKVLTARIMSESESVGVNSRSDAAYLEEQEAL